MAEVRAPDDRADRQRGGGSRGEAGIGQCGGIVTVLIVEPLTKRADEIVECRRQVACQRATVAAITGNEIAPAECTADVVAS